MRRSLITIAVIAFGALPVLAADDYLAMPFECRMNAGQLTVTAAPMQTYKVKGKREQRVYTACREAGSAPDCKTMMLHRFSISCGGVTVPWLQVVARIRSETVGASWLDGEQLNFLTLTHDGNSQRTARFVMPKGFAPVTEVGAFFSPTAQPFAAASARPGISFEALAVEADATDAAVAAAAADAAVAAAADAAQAELESAGLLADSRLVSSNSWRTEVSRGDAGVDVGEIGGIELAFSLAALMLTAALATFGFLGGRLRAELSFPRMLQIMRSGPVREWLRVARGSRQLRTDNQTFYNGVDSVAALLLQVESAVHSLRNAGPLRETLSEELKSIRQRLATLRRAEQSEFSKARTSANLRAIVRDLERIRRIADSAAVSMPGGRQNGSFVPRTAAEAYELLGINSSVSEETLKKIVDGLRMSWHPDLARDDADRDLREERTKCINIAWDLITGKRAA